MMKTSIQRYSIATAFLSIALFTSSAFAQQGGDPGTGGDTGGLPTIPGLPGDGNAGQNNIGGSGDTGGGEAPGIQDLLDGLESQFEQNQVEFSNERNVPFVGRSIERYLEQDAGAHPRTNLGGNSAGGGRGAGGLQFSTNRGNAGRQGAQQGNQNQVIRKSLRTRLAPQFSVGTPVSSQQVRTRFQQRLTRIPATGDSVATVQVRMDGKTAYLSGSVANASERDRVERMARLEPGIYKIENRIQVRGQ